MGIGIVTMGVGVVTIGVGVVESLLPVTWKRFSFQLLNFDSLRVNQTRVSGKVCSKYHCWRSSMFLMSIGGSLLQVSILSPLSLTVEYVYSSCKSCRGLMVIKSLMVKIQNAANAVRTVEDVGMPRMLSSTWSRDRKSTRLNSSHVLRSRMPSSA